MQKKSNKCIEHKDIFRNKMKPNNKKFIKSKMVNKTIMANKKLAITIFKMSLMKCKVLFKMMKHQFSTNIKRKQRKLKKN
jgi:hypothetical protein